MLRSIPLATWALAFSSILLSGAAQLLMKLGMRGADRPSLFTPEGFAATFLNVQVLAGLACYGVSALLWLSVLAKMPLSMAYPLVALAIAMVVTASGLFLGESVPLGRGVGVMLIIVGVALIGAQG